jgi:SnoaL-like polyketide cyclase
MAQRLPNEELAIDGDKVRGRTVGHGTHLGPYVGRPAAGCSIAVDVIDIVRIKETPARP